jgi:hypothetical protein
MYNKTLKAKAMPIRDDTADTDHFKYSLKITMSYLHNHLRFKAC